jgi:hypothetical protein
VTVTVISAGVEETVGLRHVLVVDQREAVRAAR